MGVIELKPNQKRSFYEFVTPCCGKKVKINFPMLYPHEEYICKFCGEKFNVDAIFGGKIPKKAKFVAHTQGGIALVGTKFKK